MGTIRKRGTKWQAMVRKRGHSPLSKTFLYKADAQRWVQETERSIERVGLLPDRSILRTMTFGDLLRRYRDNVSPKKRGHTGMEKWVIGLFLRQSFAHVNLTELRREHIQQWCDERLAEITPRSLRRQLSVLSHVFTVAETLWHLPVVNLTKHLVVPPSAPRRQRRVSDDEWAALVKASEASRNRLLIPLALLAKETSMRRGELLALRWQDIGRDFVTVRISKNGESRTLPLSATARRTLDAIEKKQARVFPVSPSSVAQAWRRLAKRAGLNDLHFHDLRHEAISRFFELGLTAPEVQSMSGHKDMRMLYSYAHANRANIIQKLNNIKYYIRLYIDVNTYQSKYYRELIFVLIDIARVLCYK